MYITSTPASVCRHDVSLLMIGVGKTVSKDEAGARGALLEVLYVITYVPMKVLV